MYICSIKIVLIVEKIMKQITLNIPDKNFSFFMKVVENFQFVKIAKQTTISSQKQVLENLKEGLEEVKLYKEGKIELKSTLDLINEL